MDKIYFTAFCVMNSADLRANLLHHSCLVFLEADRNIYGQLVRPLRVVSAYGYYSHPIPERPSILTPVSLFAYMANIPRIAGSYGEWRRENIHDLSLGRGLTGRLFEMNYRQFRSIQENIRLQILCQDTFFNGQTTIQEKEAAYQRRLDEETARLVQHGMSLEDAEIHAHDYMPLHEFNPANNCKVTALNMIETSYKNIPPKLHDYIQCLKGGSLTHIIPRLTNDLEEIIIHAETDKWEVRGNTSKYPYYDWNQAYDDRSFNMYVIDYGRRYIDQNGDNRWVSSLSEDEKDVVKDLKTIGRICEINLSDIDFKSWHSLINDRLSKIASHPNSHVNHDDVANAHDFLNHLLANLVFIEKTTGTLPPYLDAELKFMREHRSHLNVRWMTA